MANKRKFKQYTNAAYQGFSKVRKVGGTVLRKVKQALRNQRKKQTKKSKIGWTVTSNKMAKVHGRGVSGKSTVIAWGNHPPKKSPYELLSRIGNSSTYIFNYLTSTVNSVGVQSVNNVHTMNSQAELIAMWSRGTGHFQPAGGGGPGTVREDYTNPGFKSTKFLLKKCSTKIEITSQSPAVTNLEIWTLVSKVTKETYTSPATDWITGWEQENQGGGITGLIAQNQVGVRPTSNKLFNMNWKVKGVKKLQLMGGQTHTHTNVFNMKRYVDTAYWNTYAQIRGITVVCLCISWGQIADTVNDYSVSGITSTPGKLLFSICKTYNYDMVNAFPRSTYTNGAALTPGPLPHVYILNEESGGVTDVQNTTANTNIA